MARYRKIDVRIHSDEKVRRLSPPPPSGRTLWFYLLTNQSTTNIPGLYRAGEAQLAEELEWPLRAFRRCFKEITDLDMARADWGARLVWVPNVREYDPPASPNVVISWQAALDEIPECELKREAINALADFCKGLGPAFAQAFARAARGLYCPGPSGKGIGNPSGKASGESAADPSLKPSGSPSGMGSPNPDPRSQIQIPEGDPDPREGGEPEHATEPPSSSTAAAERERIRSAVHSQPRPDLTTSVRPDSPSGLIACMRALMHTHRPDVWPWDPGKWSARDLADFYGRIPEEERARSVPEIERRLKAFVTSEEFREEGWSASAFVDAWNALSDGAKKSPTSAGRNIVRAPDGWQKAPRLGVK